MSARLGTTPSQTVGPFLRLGLTWPDGPYAAASDATGAIWLSGHLYDGNGDPVPDGVVETWQADPDGRFDHPDDPRGASTYEGFRGFGRFETEPDGGWRVCTLKPGRVPDGSGGLQAPHIDVSVLARGLLHRVVTRIYFADEAEANASDPVLRTLDPERVQTLIARPTPDGYALDIRLQGERETVFFSL